MTKTGIVLSDELLEKIEEPLTYGDSRSERIRQLIRTGLAAESELKERELFRPNVEENRAQIQEAFKALDRTRDNQDRDIAEA